MSDRLRKLVVWIGYPAFAVFSFFVFLYLTFPMGKLKPMIESQASAELGMEVTIDDLSPRPLAGVSAEGVLLVSKPGLAPPRPDGQKPKPARIHLDQVVVKLGVLPLIWGTLDVSFWARGLGGEVEGSYQQSASKTAAPKSVSAAAAARRVQDWEAKLDLQKFDLTAVPAIRQAIDIPIIGKISGAVELVVPESRFSESSGSAEVELDDCSVGDGKAKLKIPGNPLLAMGITLPRLRIGRLRGQITIEKGVATIRISSQDKIGEVDLELDLEGRVTLRNPIPYSALDLYLKFKLNPNLKKRSATFEILENSLTTARRPDGGYGVQVGGLLRSPQSRLSAVGGPSRLPAGRYPRSGLR